MLIPRCVCGNEYKTFRPGDIECFRFEDNGKYFVRLHGDLYKLQESYSKMTEWGVTVEFRL